MENTKMKYQKILEEYGIAPQFQEDFVLWVDTGEASDAFREYYNSDEKCQTAVELAFSERQRDVQKVLQSLMETA